ncbi:MAG: hypothetical protein HXX20_08455 [Chloroflexi bacterium]|nr:hypothetical protein [Chloroflexota bacterium]
MFHRRSLLLASLTALLLALMWQSASADIPVVTHPAQAQVRQIMGSLIDSEAEHASGAYYPGVGAFITMDLLRGPNSVKNKPSYEGTRDWLLYMMQTFGAKLKAVPPEETIAMSVEFYDYAQVSFHQLVIVSTAADIASPNKYKIWLDGRAYSSRPAEAVGESGTVATIAPSPTTTPLASTIGNKAVATANQTTSGSTTSSLVSRTGNTGNGTTSALLVATPGVGASDPLRTPLAAPFKLTPNLTNPQTASDWRVINGTWDFSSQGYTQSELGKFDLVTLFNQPLAGNYHLQTEMKFVEGEMGGGLVFNTPTNSSKKGAQMVSYTGKGGYLQWGYFDNSGVFQYQGGLAVPNGSDGQKHVLEVKVTAATYEVILDGKVVGQKNPLNGAVGDQPGGYAGLLTSTSKIIFSSLIVESL